jgi:elongation factor Ts
MANKIDIQLIKKLREETGVAIIRIREVLEEVGNDEKKALEILKKEGLAKAEKREGRETSAGKVFVYQHHTGKIVGIVELLCETDFVAKTDQFELVGKDLAMQVASMGAEKFEDQDFIKDGSQKVKDMVKSLIAKTGENVKLGRVLQIELGKK